MTLIKACYKLAGRVFISLFLAILLVFPLSVSFTAGQGIEVAQAQLDETKSGSTVEGLPTYSGVDASIEKYLCAPSDSNMGASLTTCITKAYRFGISFGAIALVFFVVMAGYFYLVGGEAGKQKGKSIFLSALTGMAIILSSYILLGFINPDLLKIRPIQSPIFNTGNLPLCEEIGFQANCITKGGQVNIVSNASGVSYGGRTCSPITNNASPASVDNLSKTCFGKMGGEVAKQASIVASRESGGNPSLPVSAGSCGAGKRPARCSGGEIPVWGLYQINLTVHKVGGLDCPSAFTGEWTCSKSCTVKNTDLYNRCVAAAKNAENNISAACEISNGCVKRGSPRFCAWGNRANEHGKKCGF